MNIEVVKRWFTEREKVAIDDATGCWNWTGCVNEKGYGVVGVPGERRTTKAHRLAYAVLVGAPGDLCVLHRCDNPRCCNPGHLFLGDRATNNRDMLSKGRHRKGGSKTPKAQCKYPRGVAHPMAKLTPDIVRKMRETHAAGVSVLETARRFSVNRTAARKAIKGITWVHVK